MFINFIKNIITYTIIQNKEHMLKLIVNDFTNIVSDYINISQEEKHKNTQYTPKFIDSYIFGFKKINEKYFYNCNINFNIDNDIYSSIYYNNTNINNPHNTTFSNLDASNNIYTSNNTYASNNIINETHKLHDTHKLNDTYKLNDTHKLNEQLNTISGSISSIRNAYNAQTVKMQNEGSSTRASISSTAYNNNDVNDLHISNDDININYYRKSNIEDNICNTSFVSSLPNNIYDMNVNNTSLNNYNCLNNYDSLDTDINSIKYNIKKSYTKKRQQYRKKKSSIKSNLYNSPYNAMTSKQKENDGIPLNNISFTDSDFTDIINNFESELQVDNLEYNEPIPSDYSINDIFTKNRTTNLKRNKYKYIIKHKIVLLDISCHIYKYNLIYYIKYKHNNPDNNKYTENNLLRTIVIHNTTVKSNTLIDYTDIINNISTTNTTNEQHKTSKYDSIFTDILSLNNILLMYYIDIISNILLNLDSSIYACALIKNNITSFYNIYIQSSYKFDIVSDNIYNILINNFIIINIINLILIKYHNALNNNINYKYLVLRIHNYIDDTIKQSTLNILNNTPSCSAINSPNTTKLLDYTFISNNGNYNLNINEKKLNNDISYFISRYTIN
jgi:hypothetical protein